jgi:hypothetical protein
LTRFFLLSSVCLATFAACGGDKNKDEAPPPGRFGEITSAVVIVNPTINQGSTTAVRVGTARRDVALKAGDLDQVRTDDTGLAVIEKLPTGPVPIKLDSGTVTLQVVAPKELYDVILGYGPDHVEYVIEPVRYPIGGQVVVVEPGASIVQAADADGTIIRLRAGRYPGNFELRSEDVLIFGEWSSKEGPLSIIEGNVKVLGGRNRMRGVKIEGELTSNANQFSAAFCEVSAANITGNGVSLIRNRFMGGGATVPSSNAVLVDNTGIP